jgi:hypothetical protein
VTTEQTRAGTTITVGRAQNQNSAPPLAQAPQVSITASTVPPQQLIAIPNNANQKNKPYPVQESVTVVPLVNTMPQNPQQLQYPGGMMHGYHQQSPYAMPTTAPVPPQQYSSSGMCMILC